MPLARVTFFKSVFPPNSLDDANVTLLNQFFQTVSTNSILTMQIATRAK